MRSRTTALLLTLAMLLLVTGCSTYGANGGDPMAAVDENQAALHAFESRDPTIRRFIDNAAGYAIFPSVGKGGFGLGAAYGDGWVYEKGKPIGYTSLTQGSVGVQLGGQVYSEVIFFQSKAVLDDFKAGHFELNAQASAVAAAAGAAADADYQEGVAVFTLPKTGLMFEASVGGQGFKYEPR